MTIDKKPEETNTDPLGYGHYAETLWARIEQALDKDNPGDDPLVVGIFGEWGTGKSKLLELIRQNAEKQSGRAAEKRAQEFFAGQVPKLTLTVPVWFHPWKYEHEPNLAIPLLMHLADALGKEWERARCGQEAMRDWLAEGAEKIGKTAEEVGNLKEKVSNALTAAKILVNAELTGTILGMATGFMTGGVINRDVTDKGLGFLRETLSGLLPETDDDEKEKKESPVAGLFSCLRRTKPASTSESLPDFKADGRFYYRVHEQLKKITRLKKGAAVPGTKHKVQVDVHINFVVFIDDLDRCLPENAVAVLELIKTLLNVESFAFVIALDDEVIERGIAHRYKDYRFENKKPDMPITGFEYLEKIIHLPFRLPQLTREQAVAFLRNTEDRLCREPDRRWLFPRMSVGGRHDLPALEVEMSGLAGAKVAESPENAKAAMTEPSVLVDLILASMDSYVPRKMIRAVELLVQYSRLTALRHVELADAPPFTDTRLDVRVLTTLIVLQLFQPELFRFMRRRVQALPVMVGAFVADRGGQPAFESAEVSDVELFRWAGRVGSGGGLPMEQTPDRWAKQVEALNVDERFGTEQIRLPLVEMLREHRLAQRHVFNPLKTFWQLAQARKGEDEIALSPYLSFLGKPPEEPSLPAAKTGVSRGGERRADIAGDALFRGLIAADANEQANLPGSLELGADQVLTNEAQEDLADRLKHWLTAAPAEIAERRGRLLRGLAVIAPWLDPGQIAHSEQWTGLLNEIFTDFDVNEESSAQLIRLKAAGMAEVDVIGESIVVARRDWQGRFGFDLEAKQRVEAGDWLGQLGDPRFEDDQLFCLPKRQGDELEDCPLPGFVRVDAGSFRFGRRKGEYPDLDAKDRFSNEIRETDDATISYAYWMARYPVTVAQWAVFMADGGYGNDALWLAQGIDWREGRYDATVTDEWYKYWLAERALRRMPRDWSGQEMFANRPVIGVCWFEAMAYARWLHGKLAEKGWVPANYEIRLPTEAEWEKAARLGHGGMVPWGAGSADAWQANIGGTIAHASPVGAYLTGRQAVLGIEEMVGNVWEWTCSLHSKEYQPGAFREERALGADEYPVIRGGAWYFGGGRRALRGSLLESSRHRQQHRRASFGIVPGEF